MGSSVSFHHADLKVAVIGTLISAKKDSQQRIKGMSELRVSADRYVIAAATWA